MKPVRELKCNFGSTAGGLMKRKKKRKALHIALQIEIQCFPQDAAQEPVLLSRPLHPPAVSEKDVVRKQKYLHDRKKKQKGQCAHKTASEGRLST